MLKATIAFHVFSIKLYFGIQAIACYCGGSGNSKRRLEKLLGSDLMVVKNIP